MPDPSPDPAAYGPRTCPDGGRCSHPHFCDPEDQCFRVHCCGPLSGVFPDDVWPDEVREANGVPQAASPDPAALRVAMRDDLVSHLSGFMTKWNTEIVADSIMADLSDRYDLDGWLAHLARRDEEVRG